MWCLSTLQRGSTVALLRSASILQFIQIEAITMATVVFVLHIFIITVHLWSHIHHLKLDLPSLEHKLTFR